MRLIVPLVCCVTLIACSSEDKLRSQLLEKTPIGSSFDLVQEFCSGNNLNCFKSLNTGYLNQDTGKVVGDMSIWAVIDEYEESPQKTASIAAYWGFDSNSELVDIWIWKTIDAPLARCEPIESVTINPTDIRLIIGV